MKALVVAIVTLAVACHPAARPTLLPPVPGTVTVVPGTTTTTTTTTIPTTTTVPTTTTKPSTVVIAVKATPCAAAIAAVEAKGLYPAPGYTVSCPAGSFGHWGVTCASWSNSSLCGHKSFIHITVVSSYVVANEFSNSRCFSGLSGCYGIDGGGNALGFRP